TSVGSQTDGAVHANQVLAANLLEGTRLVKADVDMRILDALVLQGLHDFVPDFIHGQAGDYNLAVEQSEVDRAFRLDLVDAGVDGTGRVNAGNLQEEGVQRCDVIRWQGHEPKGVNGQQIGRFDDIGRQGRHVQLARQSTVRGMDELLVHTAAAPHADC